MTIDNICSICGRDVEYTVEVSKKGWHERYKECIMIEHWCLCCFYTSLPVLGAGPEIPKCDCKPEIGPAKHIPTPEDVDPSEKKDTWLGSYP